MMIKRIFPFLFLEYLRVLGVYVVLFSLILIISNIFPSLVAAPSLFADQQSAMSYAWRLILLTSAFIVFLFAATTLAISISYSIIAKMKFGLNAWLRQVLSFLLVSLIFTLPFMFSLRLNSEQNPAATAVSIIVFALLLHFSNQVFLFTAITGKTFRGIKDGFWFGTVKIKHLLIPYVIILAVSLILIPLGKINSGLIGLFASIVILSWALLYVGRSVIQAEKRHHF